MEDAQVFARTYTEVLERELWPDVASG